MWRLMLCVTRPNGCRLGAATQFATVLGNKGSGGPTGRASSGQVQALKRLQPPLTRLSASRTFATKVSIGQPPAKTHRPANQDGSRKRPFITQPSTSQKAQAPPAPGQVSGGQKTPPPERGRTHKQPHLGNPAFQSSNPRQKPSSSVADTSVPSPGADHERRQNSLSGSASTSGTAPSSAGTSKSKSFSRAAGNSHPSNAQSAESSNGAAAPRKAAIAHSSGTSHAQPADSTSSSHPSIAPSHAPAVLSHAATSDSSGSPTAASHSSAHSLLKPASVLPSSITLGGVQHNPVSAVTNNAAQGSLPSAPEEPSMYAQKAVPFDISASQKSGTTAIRDLLETQKITLQEYAPGQKPKVLCPRCHGGSQHEASLAVNISVDSQSAAWLCHRATCGWQGAIDQKTALPKGKKTAVSKLEKPQTSNFRPLGPKLLEYFATRGISKETLERNQVAQEHTWMPGQPANAGPAIAFPYMRNAEVVNVKYRTLDKCFRQVKGAEKILYGLDDVVGQDTIIIVEGEMDKLALEEAGFMNVVSVPDGAPAKVKEGAVPAPDADTKYSYLWNCRAVLDQATRVLMATDNDPPGHALAEELARRLGRERCYRVQWESLPEVQDAAADLSGEQPAEATFRKDANEVLMKDGPQALRFCIDQAEPLPIRGLFRFSDFEQDMWSLYNLEFGDQTGKSTGWQALDEVYRVVPGELTIITGVPNSGKSEWIDALVVNLADKFGWRFGLCSMEKKVTDHARQLMEKHMRKPFFDGGYAGSTPRMTLEDVQEGMAWVDDRFFPIRYEDEALPSVDWVLNIAKAAVLRYGIRGLLVDPYNELDHQRPSHMSETEYVSQMLTKIKRFAQHHDVHVWFVAHPRQLRDWKGQPPTMYDISGSAHFINKADNGLVIHRNRDPEAGPMNEVQIFVRKVRNKAAGTIGDCKLEYDRATGCYLDRTQIAAGNSPHLFSSFAQPSADGPFLPAPESTYDEVLQRPAVNGDGGAAHQVVPASLSAVETKFLSKSADQKMHQRNYVAQHVNAGAPLGRGPEGPLSTEEIEYDDTDVKPGDHIQQFRTGQSVQVTGVR